jgi:cysteine synthase B
MVGRLKGYDVEIVMGENVSIERRKIIEAYGAKIWLSKKSMGTDGAIKYAQQIIKKNPDKYFNPNQFSNKYNKMAHYKVTSEEIWKQTNGKIDYFVSSIGTSGTIMGVGLALKENNKNIKIVCAHPTKGHYIQGLKNMEEAIVPEIYSPEKIDLTIMIETEDAYKTAREIIRKEGIFVGMSSGAAMLAALEIAQKIDKGNIVVIFPDRGEKYLSTKMF